MMPALVLAGVLMLLAAFLIGRELHRRGTFVDDRLYAGEIKNAADRAGIDPQLVRAVIFQESRFRPGVRGKDGEVGLMQILPEGAAADYSRSNNRPEFSLRELYGIECNLEIGCWYLARAVRRWQGFAHGTELALAQYNAGERRAKKWQPAGTDGDVIRNITIKSTRNYVERIMKRYRRYKAAE